MRTTPVVNEHEAATRLGLAVQTLRNWRHRRRGPAYLKVGRRVLYRVADLDEFLESRVIRPEEAA